MGWLAQIEGEAHLGAAGGDGIAHGIGGVVGDGEGLDVQVPHAPGIAGAEDARAGKHAYLGGEATEGGRCHIDRHFVLAAEGAQSACVVAVFVGEQDGVEVVQG